MWCTTLTSASQHNTVLDWVSILTEYDDDDDDDDDNARLLKYTQVLPTIAIKSLVPP